MSFTFEGTRLTRGARPAFGQVFRASALRTGHPCRSLCSTYLTWSWLLLLVMLQLKSPKFGSRRVALACGRRLLVNEIGPLGQALQPRVAGEGGIDDQTCTI